MWRLGITIFGDRARAGDKFINQLINEVKFSCFQTITSVKQKPLTIDLNIFIGRKPDMLNSSKELNYAMNM